MFQAQRQLWRSLIAPNNGNDKVGTGEYTTGFVGGGASGSDKKVGVVGLTLFDLRRRGKVGKLGMVGVNGTKYPAIRKSMMIASHIPASPDSQVF